MLASAWLIAGIYTWAAHGWSIQTVIMTVVGLLVLLTTMHPERD